MGRSAVGGLLAGALVVSLAAVTLAPPVTSSPPAPVAAGPPVALRPTDGARDPLGDGYRLERTDVRRECVVPGSNLPVCVHWVVGTADAPPRADANGNGLPDQVDATIKVLGFVWRTEVDRYGYRAPLADEGGRAGQGPNRGLDVYLADTGDDGAYGYCTSDDPDRPQASRVHAYCVLDDDFAAAQFPPPNASGPDALEVAAAHEFFHAVQFAYRLTRFTRSFSWLREGTAVWIEDEVFDDVNDGYSYLRDSPLLQPEVPLDAFPKPDDGEDFEYGAWLFWRFLSEYLGTPDVVRQVWGLVSDGGTAIHAVRELLGGRRAARPLLPERLGWDFARAFHEFGVWNRRYVDVYEEGEGYRAHLHGAVPPSDATLSLGDDRPTAGPFALELQHLSTRYVDVEADGGRVTVRVDLPDAGWASATLVVDPDGPDPRYLTFDLDRRGIGEVSVSSLRSAVIVLTNASARSDDQSYRFEAEATR
jgi:hypothetical protein